jgi:hypothetical protein
LLTGFTLEDQIDQFENKTQNSQKLKKSLFLGKGKKAKKIMFDADL